MAKIAELMKRDRKRSNTASNEQSCLVYGGEHLTKQGKAWFESNNALTSFNWAARLHCCNSCGSWNGVKPYQVPMAAGSDEDGKYITMFLCDTCRDALENELGVKLQPTTKK